MRTILLTGSTGFVGSNILTSKLNTKYKILSPSSVELDLTDRAAINNYLSLHNPYMIIHAAGKVGGILKNISSNYNFLVDNSLMSINLISGALENNIENLLNISSSCIYPKNFNRPINETDLMSGHLEPTNEGYAIAKILGLKLTELISADNKMNYKTIIPCNLFGPNDNFNEFEAHMIPAVITKIHKAKKLNDKKVDIWGDGKSKREFMYINDLTDFIIYAVDNFQKLPNILNVGTGKDFTINEYYEKISKIIGFEGSFEHDLSKPSGMKRKLVDISNLKKFGWNSSYSLDQGIQETYQFYLENYGT